MAGPSVTVEMSGNELKLLKSLQKIIDKNRELDKSLKDSGKTGEEASKKIEEGNKKTGDGLDSAIGKVGKFAAGFASAGTAIAIVKGVIDEMNKSLEESKRLTETLAQSRWDLASVADNPEEYRQFQKTANRLAGQYGLSATDANRLVFSADSANYMGDVDYAARVARAFGQAPTEEVAAKLPQMYMGQLSATEALAGAATAMKESPADFAQIASAMGSATEGGSFNKSSPDEMLATLSVLAGQFGNVSSAADRMKAFGIQMQLKEGFQGLGFVETIKKLQAMPAGERQEVLGGGLEMNSAFQKMANNLPLIESRRLQIRQSMDAAGTGGDRLSQIESNYFSDATNRALDERDRAKIAREIEQEKLLSASALMGEAESETIRRQQQMLGANQAEIASGSLLSDAFGYLNPRLSPYGRMIGSAVYQRVSGDTSARPYTFPQSQQDAADAASQAVRKTLVDISQQSRGPSTLASPDVDR